MYTLEGSHYAQLTPMEWKFMLPMFKGRLSYISYLKFFHMEDLSLLHLFIYLFSHLFVSVWMHGYLFSTLGYNPLLLYFVAKILPALVIVGDLVVSVGSRVSLTYPH